MISPEVLRKYRFFSFMTPAQLREVAMISTELEFSTESELFATGDPAENLYLLEMGNIELHYVSIDENLPHLRKDFLVGVINPGEIFGISALIEPHVMGATAKTIADGQAIQIDATELRRLSMEDSALAYGLQKAVAEVAMSRITHTRVLLAGASSPLN
jgi:CRP-like cAMP-binding protein